MTALKVDLQTLDHKDFILIKNARQNNLKGIDLAIPQNKFVVITGVSGSGKSSLAFDTLYAEGQRRYIESLSAYVRQFLGKIDKPEVDYIKGLSPAIAIQQKVNTNNPRSTVGTTTEIYDYLKLLYARVGKTYSPKTGLEVRRHTVNDVVNFLQTFSAGTRAQVLAPIIPHEGRDWKEELGIIRQKGFPRIQYEGQVINLDELLSNEAGADEGFLKKLKKQGQKLLSQAFLLIDRVKADLADSDNRNRIEDSVQTAFFEGHGSCFIEVFPEGEGPQMRQFSNRFEEDGVEFEEPSVNLFTYNNPFGACRKCEGFGTVIGIDEEKVIPDKSLSVFDEAVACWRGMKMSEWKNDFVRTAIKYDFPIHRAYADLNDEQKELLWEGNKYVSGINDFFKYVETKLYKIQYRVMLARYKGRTACNRCKGSRLRKEAQYVNIGGTPITNLVLMPINRLRQHFDQLELNPTEEKISRRILTEINNRIDFLLDVGLGYLTLNRASRTLSGGESQRIQLVTTLGSNLTGAMYILDEPSIGLHPRDTHRLIRVLNRLKQLGNTVVVVEHDEEIIRAADYIIDIGPLAGTGGGEVIYQGDINGLVADEKSLTTLYLKEELNIPVPAKRRDFRHSVSIVGANKHNLKNVDVQVPLNCFTAISGVSGSGKSTLVKEIIFPALKEGIDGEKKGSKNYREITGPVEKLGSVEYVDQNPIGRSSRSNPVTYMKAFDPIRELFSNQRISKVQGFMPSHFSFNVEGGRCEECKGEGVIHVEMQFMADISLKCETCNGKRYKENVLQVEHKGKNIYNVLDLTVDEAVDFFVDANISNALRPLQSVGLGYLKLGQSSDTLSGGEAQRMKLATFLTKGTKQDPVFFIFDEPTTGLHFHDINHLLNAFNALIGSGHTVMVIEHNLEVLKNADWIIDLGPEGGQEGGEVLFQGRPEELIKTTSSYTGKFLADKL